MTAIKNTNYAPYENNVCDIVDLWKELCVLRAASFVRNSCSISPTVFSSIRNSHVLWKSTHLHAQLDAFHPRAGGARNRSPWLTRNILKHGHVLAKTIYLIAECRQPRGFVVIDWHATSDFWRVADEFLTFFALSLAIVLKKCCPAKVSSLSLSNFNDHIISSMRKICRISVKSQQRSEIVVINFNRFSFM